MTAVEEEKRRKLYILQTYCKIRENNCEGCMFNHENAWCTYKQARYNVIDDAMKKLANVKSEG